MPLNCVLYVANCMLRESHLKIFALKGIQITLNKDYAFLLGHTPCDTHRVSQALLWAAPNSPARENESCRLCTESSGINPLGVPPLSRYFRRVVREIGACDGSAGVIGFPILTSCKNGPGFPRIGMTPNAQRREYPSSRPLKLRA